MARRGWPIAASRPLVRCAEETAIRLGESLKPDVLGGDGGHLQGKTTEVAFEARYVVFLHQARISIPCAKDGRLWVRRETIVNKLMSALSASFATKFEDTFVARSLKK